MFSHTSRSKRDKVDFYQTATRTRWQNRVHRGAGRLGLYSRLAQGQPVTRIAEDYQVPHAVVEFRIGVTRLSDLLTSPTGQLPLLYRPSTHG